MSSFKRGTSKSKKINFLVLFIEIALVFVLCISVWEIVSYYREGNKEKNFNQNLAGSAVSEVVPEDEYDYSSEVIDLISPFDGFNASDTDLLIYPDIQVDLNKAKEKYPKIIGWLYCPGTPINYPVVQGEDNVFFVDHMPNGVKNAAGSIFMDFRDPANLSDFVQILYGHNMKNNSMFGTILEYRRAGYFEEHPFMFYFTEDKIYRLEIFAGVNTIASSGIYDEPTNKETFISSAFSVSTFRSSVTVTPEDKIILLSTCSGAVGQENRYVLYSKLVEIK